MQEEARAREGPTHPRRADPSQRCVARRTEEVEDDVELVDVVLALEDGAAAEELGEDAPDRPDVDCERESVRQFSVSSIFFEATCWHDCACEQDSQSRTVQRQSGPTHSPSCSWQS